jgi:hypothetical protein
MICNTEVMLGTPSTLMQMKINFQNEQAKVSRDLIARFIDELIEDILLMQIIFHLLALAKAQY